MPVQSLEAGACNRKLKEMQKALMACFVSAVFEALATREKRNGVLLVLSITM